MGETWCSGSIYYGDNLDPLRGQDGRMMSKQDKVLLIIAMIGWAWVAWMILKVSGCAALD